jgi:hypothetical protein
VKIKTSELAEAALDWAAAKCEGGVGENQLLGAWYAPSTNWAQGGPIIEREKINPEWMPRSECWMANCVADRAPYEGPTPLIAAMRCYVASKLGDEVEIPEELK